MNKVLTKVNFYQIPSESLNLLADIIYYFNKRYKGFVEYFKKCNNDY